jgi:hypothetical protein
MIAHRRPRRLKAPSGRPDDGDQWRLRRPGTGHNSHSGKKIAGTLKRRALFDV